MRIQATKCAEAPVRSYAHRRGQTAESSQSALNTPTCAVPEEQRCQYAGEI